MSRDVVIFGGCGFFGTHLARHLAQKPDVGRIILADIREPRELVPKAEYRRIDIREPIELDVGRDPRIYNFAAVHTTPGQPRGPGAV